MSALSLPELFVNLAIVVLLSIVLAGYRSVNRKIAGLHSAADPLENAAQRLEGAVGRAAEAIAEMRTNAEACRKTADGDIARSRAAANELALLLDDGERHFEKLEKLIAQADRLSSSAEDDDARTHRLRNHRDDDRTDAPSSRFQPRAAPPAPIAPAPDPADAAPDSVIHAQEAFDLLAHKLRRLR